MSLHASDGDVGGGARVWEFETTVVKIMMRVKIAGLNDIMIWESMNRNKWKCEERV